MNKKYLLLPLIVILSGCSQISQIHEPDKRDENLSISKVQETIYQESTYDYTLTEEEKHYLESLNRSNRRSDYYIIESEPMEFNGQIELDTQEPIEETPVMLPYEEPIEMIESRETVPSPRAVEVIENDMKFTQGKAKKIVVFKSQRVLELFDKDGNILSRHRISLGKNSYGTKIKKGDYRTPEGKYRVVSKQRDNKYYKKIRISYPNRRDKLRAKKLGVNPGGNITIHAQVPWNWSGKRDNFTLTKDWTEGCIAMTNRGIDMIWDCVSPKTVIEIRE